MHMHIFKRGGGGGWGGQGVVGLQHSNFIHMKSSEFSQTDSALYEYCVGSECFGRL